MSVNNNADRAVPSSRGAPESGMMISFRGQLASVVYERLSKALGARRAAEVMSAALARLNGMMVETPQDMLAIADVLVQNGGLVQAVGRSLKVQALLRGAVER